MSGPAFLADLYCSHSSAIYGGQESRFLLRNRLDTFSKNQQIVSPTLTKPVPAGPLQQHAPGRRTFKYACTVLAGEKSAALIRPSGGSESSRAAKIAPAIRSASPTGTSRPHLPYCSNSAVSPGQSVATTGR